MPRFSRRSGHRARCHVIIRILFFFLFLFSSLPSAPPCEAPASGRTDIRARTSSANRPRSVGGYLGRTWRIRWPNMPFLLRGPASTRRHANARGKLRSHRMPIAAGDSRERDGTRPSIADIIMFFWRNRPLSRDRSLRGIVLGERARVEIPPSFFFSLHAPITLRDSVDDEVASPRAIQ